MNPINDDELRAHLARRSAEVLPASEREALLGAVGAARVKARQWSFRPALILAPVAAAVVLAVLAYPLLLTLAPGPNATPSASPPGEPPTSSPPGEPGVYTAQQLSDMIGKSEWLDRVVLAQARISPQLAPLPGCTAPTPCEGAFLAGIGGKNRVTIAWRDAAQGEGERVDDGSTIRWLQLLALPPEPGLFAFKVQPESVEFLGPVIENADHVSWPMNEVPIGDPNAATDDLYAVDGWLLETIIAACPPPSDYAPETSTEYWCGGSFLRGSPAGAPQTDSVFQLGGLHVQWGAYEEFAPNPSENHGQGTEPRQGTYLVRQVGCQPVTGGECPVWRMVGRLL